MALYCKNCKKIFSAEVPEGATSVTCPLCGVAVEVPETPVSPGAVLGDFLIEKLLSRGGMGAVFLARQVSLDRLVALKVLQEKFTHDKEYVDGLIYEARAAAKLNHPHIVQAYAVGEDHGIYYFAMEYVRGETFKQILRREKVLDFEQAAKVIYEVASALDVAWREQKLVHQDIKPDNIMLDPNGFAKLADLGLARTADAKAVDEDEDEVLGTPQYISPEQLTGVPTDVRSDIYSLGATFYQFITGSFPYVSDSAEELARMHVEGNLTPPSQINPQIPEDLEQIVLKMMARDINARYQSPRELMEDLEHFRQRMQSASRAVPTLKLFKKKITLPPVPPVATHTPAPKLRTPSVPPPKPPTASVPPPKPPTASVPPPKPPTASVPPPKPPTASVPPPKPPTASVPPPKPPTASMPPPKPPTASMPPPKPPTASMPPPEKAESTAEKEESKSPEVEEEKTPVTEEKSPKKSRRVWRWLIIAVIILLVLGGALAGTWFLMRSGKIPVKLPPEWAKRLKLPVSANAKEATVTAKKAAATPVASVTKKTAPVPSKPVPPPPPKLVPREIFTVEIDRILADFMTNPDDRQAFLQAADQLFARMPFPDLPEERAAFIRLRRAFDRVDEQERIEPRRTKWAQIRQKKRAKVAKEQELIQIAQEKQREEKQRLQEEQRQLQAETRAIEAQAAAAERERRAELSRTIDNLYYEVVQGFRGGLQGDEATYQAAWTKAKNFRLPRECTSKDEKNMFRNLQTFCNCAAQEFKNARHKIKQIIQIKEGSFSIYYSHAVMAIKSIAPDGRIYVINMDKTDRPVEQLPLKGKKVSRDFFKQLCGSLKMPDAQFYYALMNWKFSPEDIGKTYNSFWKRYLKTFQRFAAAKN